MNREIKFRGKRYDSLGFVYGFLIKKRGQSYICYESEVTGLWNTVSIEDGSESQFTGLHDKNGVEIYEGDILIIKNGSTTFESNFIGKVLFSEGEFVCEFLKFKEKNSNYFMPKNSKISIKNKNLIDCVGNIYENPELLK